MTTYLLINNVETRDPIGSKKFPCNINFLRHHEFLKIEEIRILWRAGAGEDVGARAGLRGLAGVRPAGGLQLPHPGAGVAAGRGAAPPQPQPELLQRPPHLRGPGEL